MYSIISHLSSRGLYDPSVLGASHSTDILIINPCGICSLPEISEQFRVIISLINHSSFADHISVQRQPHFLRGVVLPICQIYFANQFCSADYSQVTLPANPPYPSCAAQLWHHNPNEKLPIFPGQLGTALLVCVHFVTWRLPRASATIRTPVLNLIGPVSCHSTLAEQKCPTVKRIIPLSQRNYRGQVGRGLAMKERIGVYLGTQSDGRKKGLSEPSAALPLLCASCSASTPPPRSKCGNSDAEQERIQTCRQIDILQP